MEDKITQHVTACQRCQVRRTTDRSRPPLLTSLSQCTALNQRIHIESQLKELQTNLTHFRLSSNDSITDEQFSNLLHNHLIAPSASSVVIWSSLLTLLVIGLITFIFIFMYLRRRRSFQSGLAKATAPQQLSVIYNPPALAFEDEMSYITRTGSVNGSATATRQTSRAFPFQK
jgi:hypothetical protein